MKYDGKSLNLVLSGTILILIYKLISNFSAITGFFGKITGLLTPVIIGIVIAFFLYKPIHSIENAVLKSSSKVVKKFAKTLSILAVYLIIAAFLGIAIKFIAPKVYTNVVDLINHTPEYYQKITAFINENEYLSEIATLDRLTQKLTQFLNFENLNKYIGVIGGIANSFLSFFLSIVISIYIILEKNSIFAFFSLVRHKYFAGKKSLCFISYLRKICDLFYKYFCGLALDAVIIGSIAAIVFALFKIPYAVLIGLIIEIGNMIPFFGPIISAVIVFIICAITINPLNALWILIFQIILGQIDSNLIQPKIISNSTGISPLLVLVSVIVFGDLFGPIGMILGVPVCATIKMLVVDYMDNGILDGSSR